MPLLFPKLEPFCKGPMSCMTKTFTQSAKSHAMKPDHSKTLKAILLTDGDGSVHLHNSQVLGGLSKLDLSCKSQK